MGDCKVCKHSVRAKASTSGVPILVKPLVIMAEEPAEWPARGTAALQQLRTPATEVAKVVEAVVAAQGSAG